MTTDGATAQFEPHAACAAKARRFVVETVDRWGLSRLHDEAALCAAELATNAILHGRTPFTVAVRPVSAGIRIDVQDDRPDRLPLRPPPGLDPLATGTTGRGLRLVSAVCARWGYFTTGVAKTVWAELTDDRRNGSREPLIEVADRPAHTGRPVRLVDLPVRAAVASGVQIDDLVRQLQLEPERMTTADLTVFNGLLERSAAPRLMGRQEAFRAAGKGLRKYTLELAVSADELSALSELVDFLQRLAQGSDLEAVQVGAEVTAMRVWLRGEVAAQYEGGPPSPFPATGPG